MQETSDNELLREYVEGESEAAFAALVARHVPLVYSTALRQAGNPHHAEEITQAVFIILARKARSLGKKTVLSGWLYHTARLTAANFLRSEIRRAHREQEAYMHSLSNEPDETQDTWRHIAPMLDDAMGTLGEKERNAVVLRFFQGKSLNDVGVAMGTSGDAAKMRVHRALEKLQRFFSRRGIALSGAVVAGALSMYSVQAAPAGLATSITAASVQGSTAAASTLTLVKGVLKVMFLSKLKIAAAIGVAVLVTAGTGVVVTKVVAQAGDDSVPDSAWDVMDSAVLARLPSVFILRPTHFAGTSEGYAYGGNRMLARNVPIETILALAYDVDPTRIVSSADPSLGNFDLLMTTADAWPQKRERLQQEIKNIAGITGRREMREADAWVLTVRQTGAPGFKASADGSGSSVRAHAESKSGSIAAQGMTTTNLIGNLQRYFDKPIVDETGLTGSYDVSLQWNSTTADAAAKRDAVRAALSKQLGLDLAPARHPVEMIVAARTKK